MENRKQMILSVLGSVFLVLILYIILHESGHCLVAVLCGAKITEFSVLSAHMSYEGGTFNASTASLLNAAGLLLPLLISGVYMLFYSKTSQNTFYRIFSFMFGLLPFFSLIAWVFVPLLYLSGNAPAYDDVTQFLDNSGMNPWIVCLAAALLLTCGFALAWKKKIVQNYWQTCRGARTAK